MRRFKHRFGFLLVSLGVIAGVSVVSRLQAEAAYAADQCAPCYLTNPTTAINASSGVCTSFRFKVTGTIDCAAGNSVQCGSGALTTEVYENVSGTWFNRGSDCIDDRAPNCDAQGTVSQCYSPSSSFGNLSNGNVWQVYTGWSYGTCPGGGSVIGTGGTDCIQYQYGVGYTHPCP